MCHRSFLILSTAILSLSLACSDMLGKYDDGAAPSGGFTINDGAARTVSRTVTLTMKIQNATEMRFSNDGAAWSDWEPYAAAKSWDLALGPQLQTVRGEFKSKDGKLLSASDSIDPFIEEKIVASDGHANDQFGGTYNTGNWQTGISISNDGTSIVVGCSYDDIDSLQEHGSAYLYQWNGLNWLETKFVENDIGSFDYYGWSVAIAGNGKRIAISSMTDDVTCVGQGSVYIYTLNETIWEKKQITASDANDGDQFGVSVSFSSDGNTLIVGSYMDDVSSSSDNYGSAFIYKWDGALWNERKLLASDKSTNNRYGWHVAMSGDAQTAVVGSPYAQGNEASSGTAYVYRWNGSDWIEKKLTASDGKSGDFFGALVAISSDGKTIAIGAPWDDIITLNDDQGSVYIYQWDGIQWVETKISASDGLATDHFGKSVSLSGDGTILLVGSRLDDVNGVTDRGSAYLYRWNGNTWNEEEVIRASDGATSDHFGYSVFISRDGWTYGITAPGSTVGSNADQGRIYLF